MVLIGFPCNTSYVITCNSSFSCYSFKLLFQLLGTSVEYFVILVHTVLETLYAPIALLMNSTSLSPIILNSMTVLDSWLNSAFKSVPGSWIWWKLKAVMKLFSQNYREFFSPCWHWEWMFSFPPFLVLLCIAFIFGQFLKGIPVLKSSEPQLSPGHNHFLFFGIYWNVMKNFTFIFRFQINISVFGPQFWKLPYLINMSSPLLR